MPRTTRVICVALSLGWLVPAFLLADECMQMMRGVSSHRADADPMAYALTLGAVTRWWFLAGVAYWLCRVGAAVRRYFVARAHTPAAADTAR
jgi:hypothetical protein